MKKLLCSLMVITPLAMLTGCVVSTYSPVVSTYTATPVVTTYATPTYYRAPRVSSTTVVVAPSEPSWGHGYYAGFGYDDNLVGSEPYYDGLGAYSSGWYTGY